MFLFPKSKQMEFACKKCSEFAPLIHPIKRSLFKFSSKDLIEYLQEHQDVCQALIAQSDDKRYGPATILIPMESGFLVGVFNSKPPFAFERAQVFDSLAEAAADYVFLNWKLSRLRPPQTEQTLLRP